MTIIISKGDFKMNSLNQSDFKIICAKARYDLNDRELTSLKYEFDSACKVIRSLYTIDFTDTEMALQFYPEIGIDK